MMKNSEVFKRFLIQTLDIKLNADEDSNMIFLDKELPKDIKKEKAIDIIKSMLENKLDYETISKVTNKTIEEIREIEESMEVE